MTRLKVTLLALAVLLLLMGAIWWGSPARDHDPALWQEYKMTHLEGH